MTWAALVTSIANLLSAIAGYIRSMKDRDYGRLKERERMEKADKSALDRISGADPDGVSDDEIQR